MSEGQAGRAVIASATALASVLFYPMPLLTPLRWLALASSLSVLVGAATPAVPDWAQPGSATHTQVPPPADFRRPSTHFPGQIGLFAGQSDIGTAVVPGSASFDPKTGAYTIHSAGYNIWYHRDEFRFLWKPAEGDFFLAATPTYPNPDGYFDRKAVLIVRQDLDDDSQEIMVALHGGGLIHLAQRPTKGGDLKEDHRIEAETVVAAGPGPRRLALEKRGDQFRLWVSLRGEPLHPVGPAATLPFKAPFYVGLGFTSHLPATVDTTVITDVLFAPSAPLLPKSP